MGFEFEQFTGTLATGLPGSPVDGQVVNFLADDAGGVVWSFRYRAISRDIYKWEFIGGASLNQEAPDALTVSSGTYVGDSEGPLITLPLAGDYDVTISALISSPNIASGLALMSYTIDGSTALDTNAVVLASVGAVGPGLTTDDKVGAVIERTQRQPGLGAVALEAAYRLANVSGGAAAQFTYRRISAIPVRVG